MVNPKVMLSAACLTSVMQFSSLARSRSIYIHIVVLGAPSCPDTCLTAVELLSNGVVAQGLRQAGFLSLRLPNPVILSTLSLFCQNLLPLPTSAEV